ncbi:Uncharacterized conserved protein [Ferrimonas sediminum]|uniref:Uncharacterized conserved protein n=1 Tax=Ferrimonas sediminum TaxID=718193 RepID=A0A1G9AG32_9GAMM|nr:transporter [Ferrimonas sediminum]SDK25510.1 Uncharacterized conserved protein [Ferrimonas sediminum]
MKINTFQRVTGLAASGLLWTASSLAATSGSHYPLGAEGVKAASAPPPGVHYRMYNTWYESSTITNNDGDRLPVGFDLDVYAQVHRIVQITDKTVLGANWGYNFLIPLIDQSISITSAGINESESLALGDVVIEPITLVWFREQFDAVFGLGVVAPTGDYSSHKAANPGLGYWSGLVTAGGTYYFDQEHSWSISTLSRTLFHGKQDDTNIRPGAEFILEGGIGKEFMYKGSWMLRPGINYCAYWQVSDDSKDGQGVNAKERKRAFGLGAELNVFYLPWKLQANIRYMEEFETKNTSEGSSIILTLTKSF